MNLPQALTRVKELEKQVADLKRGLDWKGLPAWVVADGRANDLKEFTLTVLVELRNTDYGKLTNEYAKGKLEEYERLGF